MCHGIVSFKGVLSKSILFLEKFYVHSKIEQKVQSSMYPYTSWHTASSPLSALLPQSGTFVITNEPAVVSHFHRKSIIYISFHSWCQIIYGFDRCMYSDRYPPLLIQNSYTAFRILHALSNHPSLPHNQ
jgi:hypothetical protein